MGKKLRNLVTGALATVATLLPMKNVYSQGIPPNDSTTTPVEVIGNPFSQSNFISKPLHWYGSGDVNNDGTVDSADAEAVQNGVSNWMSDVDGDGVTNSADKQMILDVVSGKTAYLPGYWNKLNSRDERVSWLKKMIAIDKTDTISNVPPNDTNWICGDRTLQEFYNFRGLPNYSEYHNIGWDHANGGDEFSSDELAKYNIPVYTAGTVSNLDLAHSVLAVLVGDDSGNMDPLNFNHWYFWSAYNDTEIRPGNVEMKDGPVSLGLQAYVKDQLDNTNYFTNINPIIKWNLNNGIPTFESSISKLVKENPNFMEVIISKGNLEDIVIDYKNIPEGQKLTPDFLKSKGYNSIPDTSKNNVTIPSINLGYTDSDTTWSANNKSYSFNRKFYADMYYGGITVTDTLNSLEKITVDNLTPVEISQSSIPKQFKLDGNYPNPFNPSTTIRYELPNNGEVAFTLYDITGRELSKIIETNITAGVHEFKLDMSNYSSGVYLLRAQQSGQSRTIKLNLIK